MESGIVEHNCLVGEPQSLGRALEASPIPAANVGIGDIVASLRNSKAHALNVQFGVAQRDIDEIRPICRILCLPNNAQCSVPSESCLQHEARSVPEQRFAPEYRLTRGGNCGAGRLSSIQAPCNRIGVY